MRLDTQTSIIMICFVYLILHGAIWLALKEYRSNQVKLWCVAGIVSGMSVVLLAMRGQISDFLFFYVAQVLMLVGNWGRMVALRMYFLPESQYRVYRLYKLFNIGYLIIFVCLIYFYRAEWEALIIFNAFYALLCFDYFRMGLKLHRLRESLGAKLLMWAGLILSATLGIRAMGVAFSGSIDDIYAPSWHQALMVIGQFAAITLSNVAFLRIFLEDAEHKKMAVTRELILTNERADSAQRTSLNLKKLLEEREEIIRQLTIFNKTAGMGALVASLAHELNQPLAVIQLNADMIELVLNDQDVNLNQDASIDKAMTGLRRANQRAATIITTLRNMFRNGPRSIAVFNFNQLVNEVLLICQPAMQKQLIDVLVELDSQALNLQGDKSQLQQVLLNLFTNAIDAFPPTFQSGKQISIRTELVDSRILLTVTDNGCGISPDMKAVVFDLLRTNKETGMGIGLWLSKAIVDSHQGKIDFTTEINKGTSFTVQLPAETPNVNPSQF